MNTNDDLQEWEFIAKDLAEEIMEIEPQTIFSGFFWVMKKILKTVKGIACVVNEVYKIQVACHNFLTDIAACGGELTQKVQNLVDAVKDIIETCRAIVGISESVCENGQEEKSVSGAVNGAVNAAKVSHKCAVNMLNKILRLNRQIKRALNLIAQIKNVPGDTNQCVMDAVDTLDKQFKEFPGNVKACSSASNPPENPCFV